MSVFVPNPFHGPQEQKIARVDVDLLSVAGTLTLIIPVAAGRRFLPQFLYARLRSMTGGALTTGPRIRIGTNGTHDNVAPLFTVPLSIAVNQLAAIPLASPLIVPSMAAGIPIEIERAGIGPATMIGDFLLMGIEILP